jgi:hypothetical protein
MKKYSHWAKRNPVSARILIVAGRVILGVLGTAWGIFLFAEGYLPDTRLFWVAGLLFIAGFAGYKILTPNGSHSKNYYYRKTWDALLIGSSFVFWIGFGNYISQISIQEVDTGNRSSVMRHQASPILAASLAAPNPETASPRPGNAFFQNLKVMKELKKAVKETVRAMKEGEGKLKPGIIVLLTLASIAMVVVLGYLLAILACSVSCGGQEALALVLFFGGLAIIGLLIGLMWLGAVKGARRRAMETAEDPDPSA